MRRVSYIEVSTAVDGGVVETFTAARQVGTVAVPIPGRLLLFAVRWQRAEQGNRVGRRCAITVDAIAKIFHIITAAITVAITGYVAKAAAIVNGLALYARRLCWFCCTRHQSCRCCRRWLWLWLWRMRMLLLIIATPAMATTATIGIGTAASHFRWRFGIRIYYIHTVDCW